MASAKEWEDRKKRWARWRKRMRDDEVVARDSVIEMQDVMHRVEKEELEPIKGLLLIHGIIEYTAQKITEDC